jgi:hypothetical protein
LEVFGGEVKGSLMVLVEEMELLIDDETAFDEVLATPLGLN